MGLKDDLLDALQSDQGRWLGSLDGLPSVDVAAIVEVVWGVLEDKVGTVQEKLMVDLTAARTQRDQALSRVNALSESVQQLQAQVSDLQQRLSNQ